MAGETQRMHAFKELAAESKLQDEGTALEQQSDKTTKDSSEHFSSTGTDARAGSRGAKLEKTRDVPQQREAVIRPQQTGKIDFSSLQNRSKFATDRTWSSGKGSPQSPSGKGRSREKGKRAGKTERGNPQQLYRLSITNPRSNPTIGIAYPQQKVTPPKKLESSRGPVSGSYRFHVPSIPEREAELQQEDLNYSRCFQEASSNLTSQSYTSQALGSSGGVSSHPHPPLSQQQQPSSMENNSTQPGSQLILADFQLSGSNVWQSPERTFNGANYGVSLQKSTSLTDANKASAFLSGQFQYGYNFLEESTSDSFPCEQNPQTQDFTDSSLGSVHVPHNSFSFTTGEGQNIAHNSTQFSNEQLSEDRNSYPQPPLSQFIQGVPASIQCPRNLSEDSASSDSSGSSSQQSEQGKTALPESTDTIALEDSQDAAITSGIPSSTGIEKLQLSSTTGPTYGTNDASTSPVNISSEDSQMSKSAPPHSYYHQPIPKTQLPSDHLNSNPHQFHSDAQRNHPYAPDRAKDDMMSYLQNSTHPKANMDGNKGYMDSFGVEHHQPPPPYSAHQLLASSLAAANLDQLDVLLTCKQCDQNFNNLASFLGHKQYCAQHTFAQNELKDISKMEDSRKFHTEPAKAMSSVSNVLMSRCPSDLHLSLLGLNKNGELISDSKDDPMKLHLFSGPGHLPVTLPELEMDAKLDSLITEALNGLGYQSDNAEIDSSFIDAFVDDDLTTVKATSNKQCLKTKESLVFESKNKQAAEDDRSSSQGKYFYDSDVENPETDKQYTESKLEKISLNLEQDERMNIKREVSHKNSRIASREKKREQDNTLKEARKLCKSEDENTGTQRFLLSSKFSERCGVKSFQESSALRGSTPSQASTSPTSRTAVKESKRKNSGGGTWSKELIHKIVQQKNKLHKLHVKGTKNLQFSLVMERLTPTVQNPAFGEYDYVSDTDDECEPVKIASQGRLNQSSRCKYTYTKECKWRARSERDQAAWRHESKECFEVKKSEEVSLSPEKHASHQRLRRRGSRSSTSSEVSTSVSVSSDGISSPKSIDRTDSDCEKKTDVKKKEFPEQQTYERSSPQKLCKDSSTLALTFSKPVKKYNTDQAILSDSTDDTKNQSNLEFYEQVSSSQRSKDIIKNFEKSRSSHTKREKLMSPRKETGKTVNLGKNAQQREDNPCTKEEPTHVLSLHCSSTDSTPLQFDSHSNTINKEPDFNIDTHTKGTEGERPQATQPELSDSTTFEKQSDSVCMVKETINLVNDLDAHKPAALCTSLMDEVCLSPTKRQGPLIQKDTLHLMHYPLDQDQGLLKSPLSFDTSSMFGDLTGFDSGLYSDMPIQKDGFHSMENTTDKKEEFVSSFSPFLEQRDWNLIVSPVLPDEISQYKSSSEKPNEKKTDYNHVSLSLPDKIIDYSESLDRCASEDELEIKRIVNELENQLQTTKLENPTLLAQDVTKQLKMSKFSPLRLSDETESGGLDIKCSVQTMNVAVSSLPSEPFTEPWSSPFHFDLMGEQHSPHTPMHNEPGALEHLTENVDDSFITTASHIEHRQLHHDQESVKSDAEKETPTETKEEILEQKRYTENLMKSLEVISDSIFKKEPIISEHKEPNVTSLTSQQRQEIECQATDAVEREDHSEKEAITGKENILSPPNINERKDDIEFILNESLSSLSNSTDPTVDGKQPISLQPSKPTENNESKAGTKVTSEEDITENSHLIESAPCSSVVTQDPHVVEESDRDSNAAYDVNHLFENSDSSPEHLTTNGYEEAEAVKGITDQSFSQPSSPALPDIGLDIDEQIKTADKEHSTENHDSTEDISSFVISGVECSDSVNEEITAEQDPLIGLSPCENRSPANTYSASPTTALSMKIVTTDEPCSPILVEPNTESTSHCSPFRDTASMKGQSNLLIISQSDALIERASCKVSLFEDSLEPETGLGFQKQDDILNVQDIKEHLPIDFLASRQNSPCREEDDESDFPHTAPPTSPLTSASDQTTLENWNVEEESCQSQSKSSDMSVNQGLIQNIQSPMNTEENCNENEALNSDRELHTTAEIEYSLISPHTLDLGVIECKIPTSEISIPSPLPVTSSAEPAEVSDCLEKSDSMCDFKLSPLNYNSISDEPPQLNQYDYISPASEHSENADIKQSPRDDCGACDLSVNPALIFNKAEVEAVVSLNSDPAAKIILSDEPLALQQKVCEQKASEDSLSQEILRKVVASDEAHPLSCLSCSPVSPPGISPDLKALLDDDTTFSQLFPRDDDAKRKKCPRVYSKRNKRQKLSPDTNVTQESPPLETLIQSKDQFTENKAEEIFSESQTNRCEYETISIDDAIMLNMCHNSTLNTDVKEVSDAKQSDQQDVLEDVKEVCNSPLNPLESTVDESSIEWSGSSGLDAGSTVTSDPSSCKAEEPTPPSPSPPPSAPHIVDPCVTKSIQTFQSIDIQNINTTFQLPEIKFFDPKKDISVAPRIAAVDVENRDDEKSKKVMERRGRKRKDGGIKVKDKQYKCKVCFTWFLTLGELNFHKLSHNPSPPPTCYMCVQRKFSSREQLRDHLREKHAKNKTGIWTCGMCLKEISDVWMYNEHLREHATQFARRGQTQGSMLGIPGCFMQETAVKNFITSIMQHRPSKASRESSKATKEKEKAVAADSAVGEGKSSEGAEPKVHKTKSSSGAGGKQSTLTPLEVLHKTETPKSVEMHPNCKDPSRDCHHCGKQFPKPFKLQRHLVVHNLEKIFLCHKCPVSYQEAQELKGHLKREHEEVDEPDSKHTTLYTCELCADVMHVIKKSFICSTCNYTFSKKEQFDRHMEKHLSGGNKIFKFRGVLRPVKASAPKEDECDSPASKKRRILSDSLQENSSDSGIASVSSLHLNQNSESSKPSVSTSDDSTQTITNEYHSDTNNTNVKTEDVAEDYSDLLVELEKCIHMGSSESDATKKEELDTATSPLPDKDTNGKSISDPCDVKEENESVCIRAETTSWSASKESSSAGEDTVKAEDSSAEGDTTETGKETDSLPLSKDSFVSLKENPIISKTLEAKRESAAVVMDQQSDDEHSQKASNNDSKQLTLSQGAEPEGNSPMKDKASSAKTTENTKNRTGSMKATDSTPVINSKVEDKDPLRQQKKRKDMKSPHSLQRVSSPATQENFGVDSRAKKKCRPSKCANQSLQRKADGPNDYPVLSSVRDDVVSNKIVSKCKTSNLGLQSKRNLLDGCTQKKAEIPLNGDYKAKKGPLGRPMHPPISKV
ncbi:hypothetical protein JOQ06_002567, partial [Pogonophryne albipinna]